MSTHLAQQVLEAGDIGLCVAQSPFGLLLALTELQYPGGFFDDGSAIFGTSIQYRVELTLRDDDVLVMPHATVGEQFLYVEQSTGGAVDRVLTIAVAKQSAGDCDLAEIDWQRSGGVVDSQRHLGATECCALLGASEDHVVHLLRSHGGWRLRAEHPGHCVDNVGLAAAVGSDHDGDAGFEIECRRVRERLEAFERQRFQKQRATPRHSTSYQTTPL